MLKTADTPVQTESATQAEDANQSAGDPTARPKGRDMVHRIYHRVVPESVRLRIWAATHQVITVEVPAPTPAREGFRQALDAYFGDDAQHEMKGHWMQYALDTNARGDELARFVAHYMPLAGKRHLDIGSAYAGTTIGFAKAGAYAHGIEIDPLFYRLGMANLSDYPGLPCMLVQGDILDPATADSLGLFDIMTCSNVIEHVASTTTLLATMRRLLRPGGMCHLIIPNPFSIQEVRRDGHYGLFGLTLLTHPQAEVYWAAAGNAPSYDVGEYCFTYADYDRMFGAAGLELELTNPITYEPGQIDELRRDVDELPGQAQAYAFPNATIGEQVTAALAAYRARFDQAYAAYEAARGDERRTQGETLLREFRQPYWAVLARASS